MSLQSLCGLRFGHVELGLPTSRVHAAYSTVKASRLRLVGRGTMVKPVSSGYWSFYLSFARHSRAFFPKALWECRFKTKDDSCQILGGKEAEGFGVDIHDRQPPPALR